MVERLSREKNDDLLHPVPIVNFPNKMLQWLQKIPFPKIWHELEDKFFGYNSAIISQIRGEFLISSTPSLGCAPILPARNSMAPFANDTPQDSAVSWASRLNATSSFSFLQHPGS